MLYYLIYYIYYKIISLSKFQTDGVVFFLNAINKMLIKTNYFRTKKDFYFFFTFQKYFLQHWFLYNILYREWYFFKVIYKYILPTPTFPFFVLRFSVSKNSVTEDLH